MHDFLAVRCPQCRACPRSPCLTARLTRRGPHQAREDRYWRMRVAVNGRKLAQKRRQGDRALAEAVLVSPQEYPRVRYHVDVLVGHGQTAFGRLAVARDSTYERSTIKRAGRIRSYFKAFVSALPGAHMPIEPVRTYDLPGTTIDSGPLLDGDLPNVVQEEPC